jgi:ribosome-associated heat shock protein Hsp15
MPDKPSLLTMRLDKWLWAARFYKTRTLATEAVDKHQVEVNGARAKPAREIRPGDRLTIRIGDVCWQLSVRALSMQRGPAVVAQQLYEEDAESHAARQQTVAERALHRSPEAEIRGRPTKRDRRQIHLFHDS